MVRKLKEVFSTQSIYKSNQQVKAANGNDHAAVCLNFLRASQLCDFTPATYKVTLENRF